MKNFQAFISLGRVWDWLIFNSSDWPILTSLFLWCVSSTVCCPTASTLTVFRWCPQWNAVHTLQFFIKDHITSFESQQFPQFLAFSRSTDLWTRWNGKDWNCRCSWHLFTDIHCFFAVTFRLWLTLLTDTLPLLEHKEVNFRKLLCSTRRLWTV